MANKISLPNGCYYSISVFPKNWKTSKANPRLTWNLSYMFYEPDKKPHRVIIKGMNSVKDLKDKQYQTEKLLKAEINALRSGYNPNKKKFMREESSGDISGNDSLEFALNYALKKARLEKRTRSVIQSSLNHIIKAAGILHYLSLPLNLVRRKHVLAILEKCEEINKKFSDYTFNRYRTDLKILFKELVKREAIESNPVDEFLEPRKLTKKIRETLTDEQRKQVDEYLYQNDFTFWRFVQIFFHSGARESELMLLKVKDVNLQTQYYKVIVKKGKQRIEKKKIIKNIVLPLWENLLYGARLEDYVFSINLKPGSVPVNPNQLSRRWRNIKKILNLNAGLYSLKHSNTTEIAELLSDEHAAKMNSHSDTAMVVKFYDVNRKKREDEQLKKIGNKFSG